jgi:carbon-monoxide dehydrogenase large subunit
MGKFGVGQALRRVEDQRLLIGEGRYCDDVTLPGQAVAVLLRSPHAHAELGAIDTAEARAAPGVLGVFTAQDLAAEEIGDIPCLAPVRGKGGSRTIQPPKPVLARGRVRHVGDPVAVVVAETRAQALDAAELVAVDYADLPAVVGSTRALLPGAPQLWDEAPGNLAVDWELGDAAAVARAFERAAHVTRLTLVNNRIVVNALEPRAALGQYDLESGRFTLTTSTQGSHRLLGSLSRILGVPKDRIRVLTPDVGGGFGMKIFTYSEQVLVLWAARRLGRPVKWTGERQEGFVADSQGRDHVTTAELALDAEGRFLAIRASTLADMGAYLSPFAPVIPTEVSGIMLPGLYRMPAVYAEVKCVFTNSVPVDAYRGAGRPEAAYSSPPRSCRTPRSRASPTTPATSPRSWARPSARPTGRAPPNARPPRGPRGSTGASAWRPTSSPAAASARRTRASGSTRTAGSPSSSAPRRTARATPRPIPRFSPIASASRPRRSACARATRTTWPRAAAPAARARCSWAARR